MLVFKDIFNYTFYVLLWVVSFLVILTEFELVGLHAIPALVFVEKMGLNTNISRKPTRKITLVGKISSRQLCLTKDCRWTSSAKEG